MAAPVMPFDSQRIVKNLTDAGMAAGPAEAIAQVLADERSRDRTELFDHLATKADVAAINERMAAGDRRIEERIAELAATSASHQSELAAIRERIARIEERIAAMDKRHEERFAETDKRQSERFAAMDKRDEERFAAMDKRQSERWTELDKRLADLDKRQSERWTELDKRLADLDKRQEARLDARINALQFHLVKWIVGVGLGVLSAGFALWRLLGPAA